MLAARPASLAVAIRGEMSEDGAADRALPHAEMLRFSVDVVGAGTEVEEGVESSKSTRGVGKERTGRSLMVLTSTKHSIQPSQRLLSNLLTALAVLSRVIEGR